MPDDAVPHDLAIRTRQMEEHLLRSPEYVRQANASLRRQVAMLYLAIALLILFQCFFVLNAAARMPGWLLGLIVFTSLLAIVNCVLLVRTRHCLHRLNVRWLNPETRRTVEKLRRQETAALDRPPSSLEAA